MVYSTLLPIHYSYKPMLMLTRPDAQTSILPLPGGACFLEILSYHGNARNNLLLPNHSPRLSIDLRLQQAVKLYGFVEDFKNLVHFLSIQLRFMRTILAPFALPRIPSFMKGLSILRSTVTSFGNKLSPILSICLASSRWVHQRTPS